MHATWMLNICSCPVGRGICRAGGCTGSSRGVAMKRLSRLSGGFGLWLVARRLSWVLYEMPGNVFEWCH